MSLFCSVVILPHPSGMSRLEFPIKQVTRKEIPIPKPQLEPTKVLGESSANAERTELDMSIASSPKCTRKPQKFWLELAYYPSTREYLCSSVDWQGVTSCGYSSKEALENFKDAIALHTKANPGYKPPEKPSSKGKAQDHQRAILEESSRLFGKENIVKFLEWCEC